MFPSGGGFPRSSGRNLLDHLDAAIDANLVSFSYFFLKPLRNAPAVHKLKGPSRTDTMGVGLEASDTIHVTTELLVPRFPVVDLRGTPVVAG